MPSSKRSKNNNNKSRNKNYSNNNDNSNDVEQQKQQAMVQQTQTSNAKASSTLANVGAVIGGDGGGGAGAGNHDPAMVWQPPPPGTPLMTSPSLLLLETIPEDNSIVNGHGAPPSTTSVLAGSSNLSQNGADITGHDDFNTPNKSSSSMWLRGSNNNKNNKDRKNYNNRVPAPSGSVAGASDAGASGVGAVIGEPTEEQAPSSTDAAALSSQKTRFPWYIIFIVVVVVVGVVVMILTTGGKGNKNANQAGTLSDTNDMDTETPPTTIMAPSANTPAVPAPTIANTPVMTPSVPAPTITTFAPFSVTLESESPTQSPTWSSEALQNFHDLLDQVTDFSSTSISQDPTTSNRRTVCRTWLLEHDPLKLQLGIHDEYRIQQRYILCIFLLDISNAPAIWFTDNFHECQWDGISCTDNDQTGDMDVVGLSFTAYTFFGSLPNELQYLTTLKGISLRNNTLQGTIPETLISNLPLLTYLDLSDNFLAGPIPTPTVFDMAGAATTNVSAISLIKLNNNSLTGDIPFFPNADHLSVQRNLLTDFTSLSQYATSPTITWLLAYGNDFGGMTLPTQWMTPSLERVDLAFNNWNGPLPHDLFKLPNLKRLYLDFNNLTGPLPSSTVNTILQRVKLQNNSLTGTIPPKFGIEWGQLQLLQLQGNDELSGSLNDFHCPIYARLDTIEQLEVDCANVQCNCCTNC